MKIDKRSIEDQVTEYIRSKITSGGYGLGEKLVESALAKELDVSRSTVRMALNSLVHEGLVTQKPYSGWFIFTLEGEDLWELYNLRVAIECQAASMAAEKASNSDKAVLKEIFDDFCQLCNGDTINIVDVCEKDFQLHSHIVNISGSERFVKIYNQVSNQLKSYIQLTHHDYDLTQSGISHKGIVDAICAGDCDKAWVESKNNITTFTELCASANKASL